MVLTFFSPLNEVKASNVPFNSKLFIVVIFSNPSKDLSEGKFPSNLRVSNVFIPFSPWKVVKYLKV